MPNEDGFVISDTVDISKMDFVQLEKEEKKLKVQLAKVKLDEAEGKLVSAEDIDKALTEQAIMHITKLNNDEKVLPVLLANQDKDTLARLLHEHNEEHLQTLSANLKKKYKDGFSNIDAFNLILDLTKHGVSIESIMDKLTELK